MSANLGRCTCYFCGVDVVLVEEPRIIEQREQRSDEYAGMTVANAECPACLALYIAWCRMPAGQSPTGGGEEGGFFDLSFRHSFNDEPHQRDLPRYKIETRLVRVSLFHDETVYAELGNLCGRCNHHVMISARSYGLKRDGLACRGCDVDKEREQQQEQGE